ncbi:MAG: hypothetical protein AAF611_21765 [Bacteroidota bacterium]
MLKSILKIDGIKELKKQDQSNIKGGDEVCESFYYMCATFENPSECMEAVLCGDYRHVIVIRTTWKV